MPATRFPLLLYQLPKAGQDEFAFLANRFISKARERIQKKRGRSFVRLGRFGQSDLKFGFGHGLAESYDSRNVAFQGDPSWGARSFSKHNLTI